MPAVAPEATAPKRHSRTRAAVPWAPKQRVAGEDLLGLGAVVAPDAGDDALGPERVAVAGDGGVAGSVHHGEAGQVIERQVARPALEADQPLGGHEAFAARAFREVFGVVPVLELLLHRLGRLHHGQQQPGARAGCAHAWASVIILNSSGYFGLNCS